MSCDLCSKSAQIICFMFINIYTAQRLCPRFQTISSKDYAYSVRSVSATDSIFSIQRPTLKAFWSHWSFDTIAQTAYPSKQRRLFQFISFHERSINKHFHGLLFDKKPRIVCLQTPPPQKKNKQKKTTKKQKNRASFRILIDPIEWQGRRHSPKTSRRLTG